MKPVTVKRRKLQIGNVKLLDIVLDDYVGTNPLSAALDAVEDARKRRTYNRVVVKRRARKKKRKNGSPMTHESKAAGWKHAAAAVVRKYPVRFIRQPQITGEQSDQIHANALRRARQSVGRPLRVTDKLIGLEFDLLLVWSLAPAKGSVTKYRCLCACGRPCEASAGHLLNGRMKDCGHRRKDKRRQQRRRKRQRLAEQGRQRARWKRHWGMV
jgi:hypothetical protein